jgi:hypothetical protein
MPGTTSLHLDGPCDRQVLVAVELIDPIAMTAVYRGVDVKAAGLDGKPIVSRSGRFVWVREGEAWPDRITVDPKKLPFAAPEPLQPPRPLDFARPKQDEQLVSIVLHPTTAYGFEAGVTAVRGWLRESLDADAPPVSGALVELAWRDLTTGQWIAAAWPATTDGAGQFAVFLRLAPVLPAVPDMEGGVFLRVQLRVTRSGTTRTTKDDFDFLKQLARPGRLREGLPLAAPLGLGWRELGQ